jgi:hypothetical protein
VRVGITGSNPAALQIYDLDSCIQACDGDDSCYAGSFDTNAANSPGTYPCSFCESSSFEVGVTGYNDGNIAFRVVQGSCTKYAAN